MQLPLLLQLLLLLCLLVANVAAYLSEPSNSYVLNGDLPNQKVSWSPAPIEEIEKHYFPYEQCALNQAVNLNDKNKSQTIHELKGCVHLIDNWFSKLNKRCWLGSRQQRIDNGICIFPRQFIYCRRLHQRRGFTNHWAGLASSSSGNAHDERERNYAAKTGGFALKLIDTILSSGFDTLAFAGDSMAIQMSQRLACSLARRNMTMIEYGNFYSMSEGAVIELPEEVDDTKKALARKKMLLTMYRVKAQIGLVNYTARLKYITSHVVKEAKIYNSFPGLDKACPLDVNVSVGVVTECQKTFVTSSIYTNTLLDLKRLLNAAKWGKALHVIILPIIVKENWEWIPFAKAILEVEELFRTSYDSKLTNDIGNSSKSDKKRQFGNFVVMSPLAQHFPGHPQGVYGGQVNRQDMRIRGLTAHENDKIAKTSIELNESWAPCVRIRPEHLQDDHPESQPFKDAMETLDPAWKSKIAFIDVNRFSNPWFDLHPESASTGWVNDCTHYGYNPMMYDAIWAELEALLRRNYMT